MQVYPAPLNAAAAGGAGAGGGEGGEEEMEEDPVYYFNAITGVTQWEAPWEVTLSSTPEALAALAAAARAGVLPARLRATSSASASASSLSFSSRLVPRNSGAEARLVPQEHGTFFTATSLLQSMEEHALREAAALDASGSASDDFSSDSGQDDVGNDHERLPRRSAPPTPLAGSASASALRGLVPAAAPPAVRS